MLMNRRILLTCLIISTFTLSGCFGFGKSSSSDVAAAPALIDEPKQGIVAITAEDTKESIDTRLKKADDPLELASIKLEEAVFDLLNKADRHLLPSRSKPTVIHLPDGNVRVTYLELDRENVDMQINPCVDKSAQYIARIRYVESQYEGIGKTQAEVMKGPFSRIKQRRITELARYTAGKWYY